MDLTAVRGSLAVSLRNPPPVILVALGLATLYVPTIWSLAATVWQTDDQFHGALVFILVVWMLWRKRSELRQWTFVHARLIAWALITAGLLIYTLGRSQDILLFEVGSTIPVLGGVFLMGLGRQRLGIVLFPLLFLLFMIPLPAVLIDSLTQPLKQAVSYLVDTILHGFGLPIGRSGVMLTIGPYQLLVADACSGLSSMFSLAALGAFYVYLIGHRNAARIVPIAILILPIAFIANMVRVITLVLITFYLGDEAGQGFLHNFAGMVLFITALVLLLLVDSLTSLGIKVRRGMAHGPGSLAGVK